MKVDTFACDICGVKKGEANHWFVAWKPTIKDGQVVLGVAVLPWAHKVHGSLWQERYGEPFHLCGIDCSLKFVARELAK